MSNMSYCRMENTNRDLSDCEMALEGLFTCDLHEGRWDLSESERRCAAYLIDTCKKIVEMVADRAGIEIDLEGLTRHEITEVLKAANDEYKEAKDEAAGDEE